MASITYTADNYFTEPFPSTAPGGGIVMARTFLYTVNTLPLITDIIKLSPLPGAKQPGFNLLGYLIDLPILGAASAVSLGDSTSSARYLAATATTSAQRLFSGLAANAGGAKAQSLPFQYTIDDDLTLTCTTGATSGTTGVLIVGYILYTEAPLSSF